MWTRTGRGHMAKGDTRKSRGCQAQEGAGSGPPRPPREPPGAKPLGPPGNPSAASRAPARGVHPPSQTVRSKGLAVRAQSR